MLTLMGRRCFYLLLVPLATLPIGACASTDRDIDCSTFRFDSAAWKHPDATKRRAEGELSVQQKLADGLIACDLLQDKAGREVRRLLGRPAGQTRSRGEWRYYIGPERGIAGIDTEVLTVFFRRGRVAKASLGNH